MINLVSSKRYKNGLIYAHKENFMSIYHNANKKLPKGGEKIVRDSSSSGCQSSYAEEPGNAESLALCHCKRESPKSFSWAIEHHTLGHESVTGHQIKN